MKEIEITKLISLNILVNDLEKILNDKNLCEEEKKDGIRKFSIAYRNLKINLDSNKYIKQGIKTIIWKKYNLEITKKNVSEIKTIIENKIKNRDFEINAEKIFRKISYPSLQSLSILIAIIGGMISYKYLDNINLLELITEPSSAYNFTIVSTVLLFYIIIIPLPIFLVLTFTIRIITNPLLEKFSKSIDNFTLKVQDNIFFVLFLSKLVFIFLVSIILLSYWNNLYCSYSVLIFLFYILFCIVLSMEDFNDKMTKEYRKKVNKILYIIIIAIYGIFIISITLFDTFDNINMIMERSGIRDKENKIYLISTETYETLDPDIKNTELNYNFIFYEYIPNKKHIISCGKQVWASKDIIAFKPKNKDKIYQIPKGKIMLFQKEKVYKSCSDYKEEIT